MTAKPPVIMVHGAFCGGWTFEDFRRPFETAGYTVLTPDLRGHWPGARGADVAGVSMTDYARDIAELVRAQPTPPILIGHSLGGLVAQMAATKVPLSALMLLAPSAPWGVQGGTLEEAGSALGLYALGPFWAQAVEPDRFVAKLYSLGRMDEHTRRAVYERMTPESGRAMFETLNWWLDPFMTTSINASAIKAPVFAAAGGKDLVHPPMTVRQTAKRLGASVQVFDEMSHWLVGEPGWQDVADACLSWLTEAKASAA